MLEQSSLCILKSLRINTGLVLENDNEPGAKIFEKQGWDSLMTWESKLGVFMEDIGRMVWKWHREIRMLSTPRAYNRQGLGDKTAWDWENVVETTEESQLSVSKKIKGRLTNGLSLKICWVSVMSFRQEREELQQFGSCRRWRSFKSELGKLWGIRVLGV